jgi:8-oxo-dGTP pyrophosphatase MutT (NUDIX family)
MKSVATDSPGPFAPESFFLRAREHLLATPPDRGEAGDHVLNPDLRLDEGAYRDAAVLIPVVARQPEATLLLTQRTAGLPSHAGQIAFPGGKIDAGDADAASAALREAQEEIGLDPVDVDVVGYSDIYLSRTGYRIVPVLGRIAPPQDFSLNPLEVEEIFEVPLGFLMDAANHTRGSRAYFGKERYFYEMPYQGRYIWGVTAGILRGLYERIYG